MGEAEGRGRSGQSLGTVGGQMMTPKHPLQQPEGQERGIPSWIHERGWKQIGQKDDGL